MIFLSHISNKNQHHSNVGNPARNLTFGDGLDHPSILILGMVHYKVYHDIAIIGYI